MALRLSKVVVAGAAAVLLCAGSVYVIASAAQDGASSSSAADTVAPRTGKIKSIVSVTIPVTNLDASKAYYADQLGFKVIRDSSNVRGIAGRTVELLSPDSRNGATIVLSDSVDGAKPGSIRGLFWEVQSCSAAVGQLRARSALVQDCVDAPPGPLADFTDPDGNVWTLSECVPEVLALNGLATFGVPVSDQDVSKDFYVNKLGFTVLKDRPNPEGFPGRYLELAPPAGGPTVVLATWWDTMPAGSSRGLNLTTDDYAGTVKNLQASGLSVTDNGDYASFTDPDGNTWTIAQA